MIQYNNAVSYLLSEFPELKGKYEKLENSYKRINESPGAHVVYGDILCDYLVFTIGDYKTYEDKIKKIINFIELLAGSNDIEIRNLIEISVLERLIDEEVEFIAPLLGKSCIKLIHNINERMDLSDSVWEKLIS